VKPLLQWKSNKYYMFRVYVCSLRYPPHRAHAPYCRLWPGSSKIFSTLPHKRSDFQKRLLNIKRVLTLQILSEVFLIVRRIERDVIKTVYRSASCTVSLFLS
jgi:hypothetical protein